MCNFVLNCLLIGYLILLSACSDKSENSTATITPTIVGKINKTDGNFFQTVKGPPPYIFAAAGDYFKVIDISIPSSPRVVASLLVPNSEWSSSLDYDGSNTVYIANGGLGISSVDVTDPLHPSILDTTSWDFGWTLRVKISGPRAYVTRGNGGFRIYDISNPSDIKTISSVAGGAGSGAENFLLVGTQTYLGFANSNKKFMVYDISNEAQPVPGISYSEQSLSDGVFEMAHSSDMLYVAAYSKGVKIFDVRDSSNPTLVTTIDPIGKVVNLTTQGSILYVLDDGIGLRTFNISNPSTPVPIDTLPLDLTNISANFVCGIKVDGDLAYISSVDDGVYIIKWQ
jgi:hypothetical protein